MTTYIRITDETMHWFLPLLPDSEQTALRAQAAVYAVGAVCDETACGVLVFGGTDMLLEVRYLSVAKAYQRRGIGTGMLRFLCRHAYAHDTAVSVIFAAENLSDPVYLFFASLDNFSVAREQGYVCEISYEKLVNSRAASLTNRTMNYQSYFSLPDAVRYDLQKRLRDNGFYFLQKTDEAQCVAPLCLCAKSKGKVCAALFVTKGVTSGSLDLSLAWCDQGYEAAMVGLFSQACKEVGSYMSADGVFTVAAVTPATASLVERLLPERTVTQQFYRAAWDMEL